MTGGHVHAYERIKRALLEDIDRGAYQPDQPFVTEREICSRFDVSRATAVRALSDLVHEGVLTRRRARGTFVTPSTMSGARRLTEGKTRLIGCIFHHLYGQHPVAILSGIERVCRAANYHLLLFDSEGSPRTEALNVERARDAGVRGLVVYPTDGFANAASFEELDRDHIPFVLVDRYYPALPTNAVVPDNIDIGRRLTDYLIRQGRRRIATVWEEVSCTSVQDRLAGYKQALREHGLPIDPDLGALRSYMALPRDGRRALLASWLASPSPPTAYLAANNDTLLAVTTDLLALGVNIPDDVIVASMDNAGRDPLLALATVTATLPSYEMGERAMRLLADLLKDDVHPPPRHVVLPVGISTATSVVVNLRAAV